MPLSTPPTDAPKSPRTYKTRRTEGEVALFGGQLVNAKKLARDCLNNAPLNAVRRLVQAGMPVVRLPGKPTALVRSCSLFGVVSRAPS